MAKAIEHITYQETLTALLGVRSTEDAPFAGMVNWAIIHWPPGCDAKVDVALLHNQTQILPKEGFIALDAVTERFRLNRPVEDAAELTVLIQNADSLNPHTITVILEIESLEEEPNA